MMLQLKEEEKKTLERVSLRLSVQFYIKVKIFWKNKGISIQNRGKPTIYQFDYIDERIFDDLIDQEQILRIKRPKSIILKGNLVNTRKAKPKILEDEIFEIELS